MSLAPTSFLLIFSCFCFQPLFPYGILIWNVDIAFLTPSRERKEGTTKRKIKDLRKKGGRERQGGREARRKEGRKNRRNIKRNKERKGERKVWTQNVTKVDSLPEVKATWTKKHIWTLVLEEFCLYLEGFLTKNCKA